MRLSVTVISILRLRSLVNFAASANPTWDQADVINWSNIEINIGIICACLPALRVILVHLFPKVLGTTKATDRPYYAYGSQSHGMRKEAVRRPAVQGDRLSQTADGIRTPSHTLKLSRYGMQIVMNSHLFRWSWINLDQRNKRIQVAVPVFRVYR